jgi:hypothetical protein
MSAEIQPRRDQPGGDAAPLLEYARPGTARGRRKVLPPVLASAILGAEVALGSVLAGRRNAPLFLVVAFGVIVSLALYFILTISRGRRPNALVIGQLSLALALTILAVFITLARGAQSSYGPGGLQYWFTYNPGYAWNPRWAMRYLWLAGVGAAWFVAVAAWVKRRQSKDARHSPPSPHAE